MVGLTKLTMYANVTLESGSNPLGIHHLQLPVVGYILTGRLLHHTAQSPSPNKCNTWVMKQRIDERVVVNT